MQQTVFFGEAENSGQNISNLIPRFVGQIHGCQAREILLQYQGCHFAQHLSAKYRQEMIVEDSLVSFIGARSQQRLADWEIGFTHQLSEIRRRTE